MFLSSAVSSPCVCCLMFLFRLQTLPSKRNGGRRCRKGTTARVQPSSCKVVISSVFSFIEYVHNNLHVFGHLFRLHANHASRKQTPKTKTLQHCGRDVPAQRARLHAQNVQTRRVDATRRPIGPAQGMKSYIVLCCVLPLFCNMFRRDASTRRAGPLGRRKG